MSLHFYTPAKLKFFVQSRPHGSSFQPYMEDFYKKLKVKQVKKKWVQITEKLREKEKLVQNKKAKECHSPSIYGSEKSCCPHIFYYLTLFQKFPEFMARKDC